MKATTTLRLLLLAACIVTTTAAGNDDRKATVDRMQRDFDAALGKFEDREAAQLCVALTGKADIGALLQRIKESSEVAALDQKSQAEVSEG